MKQSLPKAVIVVAGPTAVGKTAIALQLAQHFQTEIISADSRQCYKELNIGVARPSPPELALVPHHFIASHSIQEEVTAADFEEFALRKANELFHHHDFVIMVGGTGLYLKAFCEGLDKIPPVDPSIRAQVIRNYEEKGIAWLQQEIQAKDPQYYNSSEIQNPQRLMRALEVILATGKSIRAFQGGEKITRDFQLIKIGLTLPKEELIARIHRRVDDMMKAGLLDEVRRLIPEDVTRLCARHPTPNTCHLTPNTCHLTPNT